MQKDSSLTFSQLSDNLWFAQSELYYTNTGVLLSGGKALLIDPCMLPTELLAIAAFLEQQNAVAEQIILTHSHWDHILGPECFPGAKILAQANYLAQVQGQSGQRILSQIRQWEKQHKLQRDISFQIPLPNETFEESDELTFEGIKMALHHAPGHAPDQLVIRFLDSGILWASDILSDIEIPFVSHSLSAYEETLATIEGWPIKQVIPGHGHPTAASNEVQERLAEDRGYLAELRSRVQRALASGKDVEAAVAACSDMQFRHMADNAGPHRMNVESVYLELGGEANAAIGWARE